MPYVWEKPQKRNILQYEKEEITMTTIREHFNELFGDNAYDSMSDDEYENALQCMANDGVYGWEREE